MPINVHMGQGKKLPSTRDLYHAMIDITSTSALLVPWLRYCRRVVITGTGRYLKWWENRHGIYCLYKTEYDIKSFLTCRTRTHAYAYGPKTKITQSPRPLSRWCRYYIDRTSLSATRKVPPQGWNLQTGCLLPSQMKEVYILIFGSSQNAKKRYLPDVR